MQVFCFLKENKNFVIGVGTEKGKVRRNGHRVQVLGEDPLGPAHNTHVGSGWAASTGDGTFSPLLKQGL